MNTEARTWDTSSRLPRDFGRDGQVRLAASSHLHIVLRLDCPGWEAKRGREARAVLVSDGERRAAPSSARRS